MNSTTLAITTASIEYPYTRRMTLKNSNVIGKTHPVSRRVVEKVEKLFEHELTEEDPS